MARQIRLDQIADYSRDNLEKLVVAATLYAEGQLKEKTPVDTGNLRSAWQKEINRSALNGSVFNNLIYAEPVVAGTSLPPSWGGQYRTRQGAQPYLDLVAKNTQTYVDAEAARIGRTQ
jgi:hypothetical protein